VATRPFLLICCSHTAASLLAIGLQEFAQTVGGVVEDLAGGEEDQAQVVWGVEVEAGAMREQEALLFQDADRQFVVAAAQILQEAWPAITTCAVRAV